MWLGRWRRSLRAQWRREGRSGFHSLWTNVQMCRDYVYSMMTSVNLQERASRYISTGLWRTVAIHPVNSRSWSWISRVTTRYICTFACTCMYIHAYTYTCRASTPSARLPHRAIHQPTHPVRSSWTTWRLSRACTTIWSLLTYTAMLRIFAEWEPYIKWNYCSFIVDYYSVVTPTGLNLSTTSCWPTCQRGFTSPQWHSTWEWIWQF